MWLIIVTDSVLSCCARQKLHQHFVETVLIFFYCSIEYWFRCMDLDGDGVLSMYELEYFYSEQVSKMEVLGIETMVFEDCLCQV